MFQRFTLLTSGKSLSEIWRIGRLVLRARFRLRSCTYVGPYTRLLGRPYIRNGGTIVIGERVVIHSIIVPSELSAVDGGAIEIGDRTFLNYGLLITAHELVRIGRDCLIGHHVTLMDNNLHDLVDRRRAPPSQPVVLEDNVWLGDRVIVLPGVTIGHGSVIGAGSVVVKDVPAESVAVGNPARVVRSLAQPLSMGYEA